VSLCVVADFDREIDARRAWDHALDNHLDRICLDVRAHGDRRGPAATLAISAVSQGQLEQARAMVQRLGARLRS
jgi:hypothetical protein